VGGRCEIRDDARRGGGGGGVVGGEKKENGGGGGEWREIKGKEWGRRVCTIGVKEGRCRGGGSRGENGMGMEGEGECWAGGGSEAW